MDMDCAVVHRSYGNFLYRRFNDKIYWSSAQAPDKILKTKLYTCGYIEREDVVNNTKSSIPVVFNKEHTKNFSIDSGKLKIAGKLSTNRNIQQIDVLELPNMNELKSLKLSPLAKKYLGKVADYIKHIK